MDEATDPFAELTRRGHLLFRTAVQAWEEAARSMADAAGRPDSGAADVRPAIDAAFDFANQMLADQQEFARALLSLGAQAPVPTGRRPDPGAAPPAPAPPAPAAPAAAAGTGEAAAPRAIEAPPEEARPQQKATAPKRAKAQKRTPTTTTTARSAPRKRTPRKAVPGDQDTG
jgi:hypothetical protein